MAAIGQPTGGYSSSAASQRARLPRGTIHRLPKYPHCTHTSKSKSSPSPSLQVSPTARAMPIAHRRPSPRCCIGLHRHSPAPPPAHPLIHSSTPALVSRPPHLTAASRAASNTFPLSIGPVRLLLSWRRRRTTHAAPLEPPSSGAEKYRKLQSVLSRRDPTRTRPTPSNCQFPKQPRCLHTIPGARFTSGIPRVTYQTRVSPLPPRKTPPGTHPAPAHGPPETSVLLMLLLL